MNISLNRAFSHALDRTSDLLFRGWSPSKYLLLGFAAFLMLLPEGCSRQYIVDHEPESIWKTLEHMRFQSLLDNYFNVWSLSKSVLAVQVLLWVVFLFLGSRSSFVFLEDVAYDRSAFLEPWKRLRPQANSLFFWTLGYTAISIGSLFLLDWGEELLRAGSRNNDLLHLPSLVVGTFFSIAWLLDLILISAVGSLLAHFVVPLMYRDGSTASAAFRKLNRILFSQPLEFVFFLISLFVIHVVELAVLAVLVLFTCCVMGFVLMVPYVGTLVVLPVIVFIRLYSLEFLAQFGEDYRLEAVGGGGGDDDFTEGEVVPQTGPVR